MRNLKHPLFLAKQLLPLLLIPFFLLAGCGYTPTVPVKTAENQSKSVLAIPVYYERVGGPAGDASWIVELEMRDANDEVLPDVVKIKFRLGLNFIFVYDLDPGKYTIAGYRTLSANNSPNIRSTGGNRKIAPFKTPRSVTLEAGQVTILSSLFGGQQISKGSGRWSFGWRLDYADSEQYEVIVDAIQQVENIQEWEVVYQGKPGLILIQ